MKQKRRDRIFIKPSDIDEVAVVFLETCIDIQ